MQAPDARWRGGVWAIRAGRTLAEMRDAAEAGDGWRGYEGCRTLVVGDLAQVSGAALLEAARIGWGEIHCLVGGPPCQGMSSMNPRAGRGDRRNLLVLEFARLAWEMAPHTIFMEEVPEVVDMVTPEGIPLLDAAVAILQGAGYGTVEALRRMVAGEAGMRAAVRRAPNRAAAHTPSGQMGPVRGGGVRREFEPEEDAGALAGRGRRILEAVRRGLHCEGTAPVDIERWSRRLARPGGIPTPRLDADGRVRVRPVPAGATDRTGLEIGVDAALARSADLAYPRVLARQAARQVTLAIGGPYRAEDGEIWEQVCEHVGNALAGDAEGWIEATQDWGVVWLVRRMAKHSRTPDAVARRWPGGRPWSSGATGADPLGDDVRAAGARGPRGAAGRHGVPAGVGGGEVAERAGGKRPMPALRAAPRGGGAAGRGRVARGRGPAGGGRGGRGDRPEGPAPRGRWWRRRRSTRWRARSRRGRPPTGWWCGATRARRPSRRTRRPRRWRTAGSYGARPGARRWRGGSPGRGASRRPGRSGCWTRWSRRAGAGWGGEAGPGEVVVALRSAPALQAGREEERQSCCVVAWPVLEADGTEAAHPWEARPTLEGDRLVLTTRLWNASRGTGWTAGTAGAVDLRGIAGHGAGQAGTHTGEEGRTMTAKAQAAIEGTGDDLDGTVECPGCGGWGTSFSNGYGNGWPQKCPVCHDRPVTAQQVADYHWAQREAAGDDPWGG